MSAILSLILTLPRSISFLSSFLTVHGRPVEFGPLANSHPIRKSVKRVSQADIPKFGSLQPESQATATLSAVMITKLNVVV